MSTTRYFCPYDKCDWFADFTVTADAGVLASHLYARPVWREIQQAVSDVVQSIVHQQADTIDDEIRGHLDSGHPGWSIDELRAIRDERTRVWGWVDVWGVVETIEDLFRNDLAAQVREGGPLASVVEQWESLLEYLCTFDARSQRGQEGDMYAAACDRCRAGNHRGGDHSTAVPGGGAQCPCPCNRPFMPVDMLRRRG